MSAQGKDRRAAFDQVRALLAAHEAAEEKVFMRSSDRTSALTLMWSTSAWRKRRDAANAHSGAAVGASRRWQTDREWGTPSPLCCVRPAACSSISHRTEQTRRPRAPGASAESARSGRRPARMWCGIDGSACTPLPVGVRCTPHGTRECPMISAGARRGRHIERRAGQLSRALFDGRHDVRAVV